MNKKKLLTLIGCLALVGLIGVGATLAYMTDNDSALNTITMGHVDIDLKEPNYAPGPDGGEITNIKPGANIPKDPTITVAQGSEDTYIRAKLEVSAEGLDAAHIEELIRNIDIDTTQWKLSGGYYYYIGTIASQKAGVLKEGQSVKLFENVKIPAAWGNEVADKTIKINVVAEAIQADNFEPTTLADGNYGWYDENDAGITAETYNK